jgi:hypothetical protein
MSDPNSIRWESVGAIAATFGLAIWALRDTDRVSSVKAEGPLAARFRIRGAGGYTETHDLESGAVLGRSAICTALVDDPTVSKQHARVRFDAKPWIEDLDSTNGTFVNGRRVVGSTNLRRGDRIALGSAKIVFLGLVPRVDIDPKG